VQDQRGFWNSLRFFLKEDAITCLLPETANFCESFLLPMLTWFFWQGLKAEGWPIGRCMQEKRFFESSRKVNKIKQSVVKI